MSKHDWFQGALRSFEIVLDDFAADPTRANKHRVINSVKAILWQYEKQVKTGSSDATSHASHSGQTMTPKLLNWLYQHHKA